MQWEENRTNFDRNLAVVIGINRYDSNGIHDLKTAVGDAIAIADLLEKEYAYKKTDIIQLLDGEATLTGLEDLLSKTIPNQLKPTSGDRLIFYYAGHGIPRNSKDGPAGYLVPQDAELNKADSFLSMQYVYKQLSQLACHHLLVILDCCFAGTFQWAGSRKLIPILETVRREHYDRFIRFPAWQVITSSAHDQEAMDVALDNVVLAEDNRGTVTNSSHSPFALALIEGLQDNRADLIPDGVVTAHELYLYLEQRVSELSKQRQNPGLYPLRREYDRGEFIFTKPGFTRDQLKPAPPLDENNNPYRGLKSFDEKHAGFFFGRQALIEELAKRLLVPNQPLAVLLGVSGSGKSSLVKAGLIPYLRDKQAKQWYILEPMRPGELPFTSLARVLLPVVNANLLEQLSQVSFLDEALKRVLESKTEADQDLGRADQAKPESDRSFQMNETLIKVVQSWCSVTPEARLLLIEDYLAQLETLCRPEERQLLVHLHDEILARLDSLLVHLQQDPQYLIAAIKTWSQNHPNIKLLLLIDQFEELITASNEGQADSRGSDHTGGNRTTEAKQWQPFLEMLRGAIAACPGQLRVVLTLRSDFEPRFLDSPLKSYWKDTRFPVRAMNSDELRQAIEGPALKYALYFEPPELVGKLIDEVGQMPGALPLLSFTLSELYIKLHDRWVKDNASDRALRIKDYEELGGVAGALTRRATQEYDNLVRKFGEESGKAYQATMRRVMLRMVTIEGGGVARRRVPESELVYSDAEESKQVEYIVNRLVEARLLVKGQEAEAVYVEPAHDFLVRGWDQLQKWIKNEQDNLALQQRLTVAANDWHSKSQQEKEQKTLLNVLRQAETFVICKVQHWQLDREHRKQRDVEPSKRSRQKSIQYLWDDDPRLEQLKRILIKKNWFNRDEDVFVRESLIERRRNSSRLIAIVATVGLGLMGLTIAALYQAQVSSLREKVAVARNRLSTAAPITGLVLAIDATGQNRFWLPWNMLSPVQSSLLTALEEAKESSIFTIEGQDYIQTAAFSPDGKYIATGSGNLPPVMTPGTIWLRDLQGKPISKPMPHQGMVDYIAFSSDGKYIASRDLEAEVVKIWNLQGNLIQKEPSSSFFSVSDPGSPIIYYTSITKEKLPFSPTIYIKDEKVSFLQGNSIYGDIEALSTDSKYTASAQNLSNIITIKDNIHQENTNEPKILTNLRGCESSIRAIRLSVNNMGIIAVCADGKIKTWDLQDRFVMSIKFNNPGEYGGAFTFNKNSQYILTSGANRIKIWDLDGKERHSFKTSKSSLRAIAVSPNGQYIVSDSSSFQLQLWDANGNRIDKPFKGHEHVIESVAFSPDNKYIISGSFDQTIRFWNLEGENFKTIELAKEPFFRKEEVWSVKSVAFTSDRKYIIAGISTDEFHISGHVQLIDINGNPQGQPFGDTWQFALSPNGKYIAVGDANNTIQLWDMKTNRVTPLFRGHENSITSLAFSPDGRFIASADNDDTVKLWDTQGNLISTFQGHQEGIDTIMFSPDGQYIASSSVNGTVKLWPSNWKTALKVACNRLKHHPVLTAPKTDEEKSAARTCLSYGSMER